MAYVGSWSIEHALPLVSEISRRTKVVVTEQRKQDEDALREEFDWHEMDGTRTGSQKTSCSSLS